MLDFGEIELTDEQKQSLLSQVEGLKSSKEAILDEKKAEAEKAKELQEKLNSAERVAQEAEVQKLEAQGKYEEAKKLSEEALIKSSAEWENKYNTLKEENENKTVDSLISGMLGKFTDESQVLVEAYLRTQVEKVYNDGNLSIMLDGKTPDDFISGASEDSKLSNFLKGVNSSGASVTPTTKFSNANSSGDKIQSGLESRLRQKGLM